MTECPFHPGQPMQKSQYRDKITGQEYLYCTSRASAGQRANNKGYCAHVVYLSNGATQTASIPVQAVPVASAALSPPPGNQGANRAVLACAALRAAAQVGGLESDPAVVIAMADMFLHQFLLPAAKGLPTPVPKPGDGF